MKSPILLASLAALALALPGEAQDREPDGLESELDRLSSELEELRELMEEMHSERFRRLRIELDSLDFEFEMPEAFEWPSFERLRLYGDSLSSEARAWFGPDSVWPGFLRDSLYLGFDPDSIQLAFDPEAWRSDSLWLGWDPDMPYPGWGAALYGFDGDPPLLLGARRVAGAELSDLNPSLGRYFGVDAGALVTDVVEGSPAAEAGLEPGDVVTGVDGAEVADASDLRRALSGIAWRRAFGPEDSPVEVVLDIVREGERGEVTLMIGE